MSNPAEDMVGNILQPCTTHIPIDNCKKKKKYKDEKKHTSTKKKSFESYFHNYFQIQQEASLRKNSNNTPSTYLHLTLLKES